MSGDLGVELRPRAGSLSGHLQLEVGLADVEVSIFQLT